MSSSDVKFLRPMLKTLLSSHSFFRWLVSGRENFEPYGISPIGLSFHRAQQEAEYQDFILKGTVVHIRFSLVLAVILIVSFGALDPFVYQGRALIFAELVRFLLIFPAVLLGLLVTYHSRYSIYARVNGMCVIPIVAVGFSLITYHSNALTIAYVFPTIVMVTFYSFFFAGLFFRDGLVASVVVNAVYSLALWTTMEPAMLALVVTVNISLISVLLLVAMAAYQKEL